MTPLEAFRTYIGPLDWDDLVVGYDFGCLTALEIQQETSGDGTALQRLRTLEGAALITFEAHFWAACAEAVGKTPRPGSLRWSQAQDRWREALLRQALSTDITARQLARSVERIYERVGCPDDMLLMFRPSQPWSGTPAIVDPFAVERFLRQTVTRSRRYGAAS